MERGKRERLLSKRDSTTYTLILDAKDGKFKQKLHLSLGWSVDGRLLELFIDDKHTGSDVIFYMHQWAIATSKLLQYGAPVEEVFRKLRGVKLHGGTIDCDAVPTIHKKYSPSIIDAVVQLIMAEAPNGKRLDA